MRVRVQSIEFEEPEWVDAPRDGALIVFLHLSDGSIRWCFFHSPETLRKSGDLLPDTDVRIHGGANHMIVLSTLTRETVRVAIKHLDDTHQLLEFSRSCSVEPTHG